jgi:flagellar hook assembly protein FlgD
MYLSLEDNRQGRQATQRKTKFYLIINNWLYKGIRTTTTISYQLPVDSKVLIKVYDILGREVSTLFDGEQKAGYYENKFPSGGNISSGVYIYRLSARSDNGKSKEYNSIKKMMMIK